MPEYADWPPASVRTGIFRRYGKNYGVQQNEADGIGQIATDFSNATSESDGLGESAEKTDKKLKKAPPTVKSA